MKFFLTFLVLAVVIFVSPIYAQITFEKWYGGTNNDLGWSVAQTTDGGYIVTGETGSYGAGLYDVYLIKTDEFGDTLWTKTYGGTDYDYGYSVAQTTDGGYIVTGMTKSFGAGGPDVYLIKTDASGDTLWTKTYGGASNDVGWSVAQTTDGGYIIVGKTESFGAGLYDVYLIKTDKFGDTLWTKTYGGTDYDGGYSVAQTTDRGYVITGETQSFGAGSEDVYLVKTDSLGDTIWTKTYGEKDNDYGYSVAQTTDGGYVIAGWTTSFGAGAPDVYLIKTDKFGDTLWTKTYGDTDFDMGWSIVQTTDEGYIIAGVTESYGAGFWDVYLIKTDKFGDTLWTKTYGGTDFDMGYSVAQTTTDGGYIIAGETASFGAGYNDVYLIKMDTLGNVGIKETEERGEIREGRKQLTVYPNPFTDKTVIEYRSSGVQEFNSQLTNSLTPQLKIYDLSGRLVKSFPLTTDHLALSTVVSWDGRDPYGSLLPSGIYYCRFTTGISTETRKILFVK